MTDSLDTFRFDGDAFPSHIDAEGLWLELASLCRPFDKDLGGQLKTLKKEPWAKLAKFASNRTGAGKKRVYYLHADSVPGWLFGMQTAGMAPDLLAKVNRYKTESGKALRDYWYQGYALNPNATPEQRAGSAPAWLRWFAETLQKHPALWTGRLVKELARLWGVPAKVIQAGGFPTGLLAAVTFCYATAFGEEFYEEMRERTGFGDGREKRYKALTKEGYDRAVSEKWRWECFASICRNKAEFKSHMRHFYLGEPMQTVFW